MEESYLHSDNRSYIEQRVNDFRKDYLLKTQIMIRTNEPIQLIEEHVKEMEAVWFEISDLVGLHLDYPVFHIETATEWVSAWYQNVNRLRKQLHSTSIVLDEPMDEVEINHATVDLPQDLTTPQTNYISEASKSRQTWATRTPSHNRQNEFVPFTLPNATNNSPQNMSYYSPSYINSPGMNNKTSVSAVRSPVASTQTDLVQLFEQSKRNVDKIRDQCKHVSIALINQRSERDKAVAELDFIELRRVSLNQNDFLHRGLVLLEQIKEKYLNELSRLQACEERYARDLRMYSEKVALQKEEISPLKNTLANTPRTHDLHHRTDTRTNQRVWPITPSQMEERMDREELLNTFERLSSSISKNRSRTTRKIEQLSQPDFDQHSPEHQPHEDPPMLNRSLLSNNFDNDVPFPFEETHEFRENLSKKIVTGTDTPSKKLTRNIENSSLGTSIARQRLQEKIKSDKLEKQEKEKKVADKEKSLEHVKQVQQKMIEKSILLQKSRDDLEHLLSDSIIELKKREAEEQHLEEEEVLSSLKIDDARRTALKRAAGARLKAEEEKKKEEEIKEKKRRDAFKKRDERLERFRIELALKEEKRAAESQEKTPSKHSQVITNMS